VDSSGQTTWIVDAHRDVGKRFVVRSDEMLTAFVGLDLSAMIPTGEHSSLLTRIATTSDLQSDLGSNTLGP
jgi:hypothetical protein